MTYLPKSNGYKLSVGVPIDSRMKMDYLERITVETIPDASKFMYDTSLNARWEFMTVDVIDARTKAEREATGMNAVSVYSATFKLVGGTANNNWVMIAKNGVVINYDKQLKYYKVIVDDTHGLWYGTPASVMNVPDGTYIHSVMIYGAGIEAAITGGVAGEIRVEDASQRLVMKAAPFSALATAPLFTIEDAENNINTPHQVLYFPINSIMDQAVLIAVTADMTALAKDAVIKIVYET